MDLFIQFKSKIKNWWENLVLKKALQHFGLLVTLCIYTIFGGLIFRKFEHPAEMDRLKKISADVYLNKNHLIQTILNNSHVTNLEEILNSELIKYELCLSEAFSGGLFINNGNINDLILDVDFSEKWTIVRAIFFSSTILTTIGYGNIVPTTMEGKIFCIFFAFIGIPLTLTVISDWGKLFASLVSTFMHHTPPLPTCVRKFSILNKTSLYVIGAVCFLFLYLALGASLFVIWEEEWSFFDGFYFCFVTMTTIGFGDLVPKKPKYMLLCTFYILMGLALTSTIIELIRSQYLKSWRQIQALSGPLAETLKKMAENAPGLDVTIFQSDLKKLLTAVSAAKKHNGTKTKAEKNGNRNDLEEAIEAVIRNITTNTANSKPKKQPAVLQIVIYESSV